MSIQHLLFAVLAGVSLNVAGAEMQSGLLPQIVDLDTVMRLVREGPRLDLERQGIAQAEADRITAGAYPNPTVSYNYARPNGGQRTIFDARRQQETSAELPLLIAGQRGARIERAEREIEAARARVAVGASTLSAEVGAAFVALLAAQDKAAVFAAANDEVGRLREIIAGRQASGVASRYDVARIEVELGGLRAKLEDAKAEVSDRSGTLAALLGLSNWRPAAAGTLAPLAVDVELLVLPDRAINTPAVVAAVRAEAAAQSAIDVARRERWPVPAVSMGRTWTNDPYGAVNMIGVTVEIPIFDTKRGPLARAQADAQAATLRRQLVTGETAANLQRLADVIRGRRAALQHFEEDAGSRLPPLKQMAEDAYRLGRGTILELLDATRSRYELQQIRRDLAASLLEAQVRLLALLGDLERNPEPATR